MSTPKKGSSPDLSDSERANLGLRSHSPKVGDRYTIEMRDALAERILLKAFDPSIDYTNDCLAINTLEMANVFAQWANKP